jgi:hydroxymethylpyrimidine/phosphomethylpyrimidine kinase
MTLLDATLRAETYLQKAIAAAPGFGAGHGPVWHGVKY